MFFLIFCIFAGFAHDSSVKEAELAAEHAAAGIEHVVSAVTADRWMAAFAFFIFLTTMAFTLILAKFRNEVIPVSEMDDASAAAAGAKAAQQPGNAPGNKV